MHKKINSTIYSVLLPWGDGFKLFLSHLLPLAPSGARHHRSINLRSWQHLLTTPGNYYYAHLRPIISHTWTSLLPWLLTIYIALCSVSHTLVLFMFPCSIWRLVCIRSMFVIIKLTLHLFSDSLHLRYTFAKQMSNVGFTFILKMARPNAWIWITLIYVVLDGNKIKML